MINVRQICFILIFYTAASKLLQYPTLLAEYSGRDLLFSSLFGFLVQGAVVWAVAYLSSKTEKTLYELLADTFGTIVAKIVYGFFAAFFLLCAIVPLYEQRQFVHSIFYDTIPSFLVFIPAVFFTVYAGSKSLKNVGRTAEICMPIFIASFFAVLFMSFSRVDLTNLLPVFRTPATQVLGGTVKTSYVFPEPAILLMFLGHYKYRKGDAFKITLSYAAAGLIVLTFLAVFYGIYADIASSRQFAISKTSLYFSAIETVGRVDLYALYLLEVVILFALVLKIQLAVHCLVLCTGFNFPEVLSLAANAVLFAVLYGFNNSYTSIRNFFADWMWIAVLIFTIIIPLGSWALRRKQA